MLNGIRAQLDRATLAGDAALALAKVEGIICQAELLNTELSRALDRPGRAGKAAAHLSEALAAQESRLDRLYATRRVILERLYRA